MKISALGSILLLALSAGLLAPASVEAKKKLWKKKPAQESHYETDVPGDLRELVTLAEYSEILAKLRAVPADVLDEEARRRVAASPCGRSLSDLANAYATQADVRGAFGAIIAGLQTPPVAYAMANPWEAASTADQLLNLMLVVFEEWCIFLPQIQGDQDNGLAFIQNFAWFYYQNPAGIAFVQGRNPLDENKPMKVGLRFTEDFSDQRGRFMDSPASTGTIAQWVDDPRIEISDYRKQQAGDYKSWNEFFARDITVDRRNRTIPSRPATMPLSEYPDRDYIVVAPTDCIMNPLVQVLVDEDAGPHRQLVENPLQYNTVLDVKGIPISVANLLQGVPERIRKHFVGGTGLSCVLMPNTYHHFHSPVNGTVVHAEVLEMGTYGYSNWPNWVPTDGNVGRVGTDFSQFEMFERGVVIIKVTYANAPGLEPAELTGYVASIPVGLDTIGSVKLDHEVKPGLEVKRGYTRLGNFFYGGSLNILLFSEGLATGAVQTRLGNQIAIFDIGTAPSAKPTQKKDGEPAE